MTDSLSYLHPALSAGERYVFTVRASSDAGLSDASASASVDFVAGLPPFPEAPGNFTARLVEADGIPKNEALLQWTASMPAPDRSPVTGYEVFLQGQAQPLVVINALSYVHTGLGAGRRYVYYVRAVSAVGPSLTSNSAAVEVPGAPIVPISIPHVTVRADQGDGTTVTVSWVHNLVPQLQSLVTGFELQFCNVIPAYGDDRCQTGWQTHTPRFSPTTRTYTQQNFHVRPHCNNPGAGSHVPGASVGQQRFAVVSLLRADTSHMPGRGPFTATQGRLGVCGTTG